MKATLTVAIAVTALAAFAGQAFAADNAHEGYQRAFYGKRVQNDNDAAPVAAKNTQVTPQGGTRVLKESGLQAWDINYGPVNAVVSGGVASFADAHEGYRRGFAGKS